MIRHLLKLVWNRKRANALIVAEIFVSFLVVFAVVTGAAAMALVWREPLGFEWKDVWDVSLAISPEALEGDAQGTRDAVARMLDEARAFPEVESAALASTPAYASSTWSGSRSIDGQEVEFIFDEVTDDFAEVMRIRTIRGRWFNAEDDAAQLLPVVIDTNSARTLFGTADPVGRSFELDRDLQARVVGVIPSYRKDGEPAGASNFVFRRSRKEDHGRLGSHILLRMRPGTQGGFEERLVRRLQQVAPGISFRVRHMDQMRDSALRKRLAPVIAAGIIGAFLISMVALGLTGVLWQNVTRRTREIGVRRAMGATGSNVHRQILYEVVLLTTIAVAVGAVVVFQLPLLGTLSLITPSAFATGFAGALAAIYSLTVLCALYPSWLASRLTPADALRYE